MTPAAELFILAGQVDAIDAAGRMIARPVRAMISRAEILALAMATEKCWAVCIEAELLVRALALPITGSFQAIDAALGRLASEHRLPNFTGSQQANAAGYDEPTLARLRELKTRRDPRGVIRSNKPVLGC